MTPVYSAVAQASDQAREAADLLASCVATPNPSTSTSSGFAAAWAKVRNTLGWWLVPSEMQSWYWGGEQLGKAAKTCCELAAQLRTISQLPESQLPESQLPESQLPESQLTGSTTMTWWGSAAAELEGFANELPSLSVREPRAAVILRRVREIDAELIRELQRLSMKH